MPARPWKGYWSAQPHQQVGKRHCKATGGARQKGEIVALLTYATPFRGEGHQEPSGYVPEG